VPDQYRISKDRPSLNKSQSEVAVELEVMSISSPLMTSIFYLEVVGTSEQSELIAIAYRLLPPLYLHSPQTSAAEGISAPEVFILKNKLM